MDKLEDTVPESAMIPASRYQIAAKLPVLPPVVASKEPVSLKVPEGKTNRPYAPPPWV